MGKAELELREQIKSKIEAIIIKVEGNIYISENDKGVMLDTLREGLKKIPLFIAATANYSGRQQLKNYTTLASTKEGFLAFTSFWHR